MKQPRGFEQGNGLVCRLNKALYGLKQASRAWYIKVKSTLNQLGFESSKADNSLFLLNKGGLKVFVLIYVDDILVTGNDESAIQRLIEKLKKHFTLKDLGEIHHFLGIEVKKTSVGMHLSQREYIKKLLVKAGMDKASSCPTPMISSPGLSRYDGSPVSDASLYRSVVGALHYVTITRPEICFSVNKVSQFMANPLEPHWKAVKRILRYLGGTVHLGLNLQRPDNLNITGFADSDWASDIDDRRSVSGYCVYLGRNLISWSSKKQHCVSRSSTEAEYRSLAHVTSEISWIQYLLGELNVVQSRIPKIWIDNQSAIYLSSNPIMHARTKHIELDCHFVREKVAAGLIQVNYVPTCDQNADILTKPLSLQFFTRLRNKLTVVPHPELELRGDESKAPLSSQQDAHHPTLLAMPETALGLFPDVGASYFLSRLPGFFGEYVGLTGARLDGAEMFACGLATHFVQSERLWTLEEALVKADSSDPTVISSVISDFSMIPNMKKNSAYHRLDIINKCFSRRTVEEIIKAVERETSDSTDDWISSTINSLKKASPMSLKISLRSIREGRLEGIGKCLFREFRMLSHAMRGDICKDFVEGCRAILLDKDKNPKWEPSKIELISDEMVDRYFTKIDDDDDDDDDDDEWEDLKLTVRSNLPAYAIAKL
ncbi:hypothetical protein CASFOL_004409 [Castilleja foliolosa]|uniref:3-hydroxyisobutyryl-CoA hydrolase n=1 Tax=Castilleja foliolosa TaxID=1961234 RepID=A0ABD3EAZ7_9LAMI